MKLIKHGQVSTGPLALVPRIASPGWPLRRLEEDNARLLEEPSWGWLATSPNLLEPWGPAVDVDKDKDGILTATCPKTEEAKRKQVEIKIELTAAATGRIGRPVEGRRRRCWRGGVK